MTLLLAQPLAHDMDEAAIEELLAENESTLKQLVNMPGGDAANFTFKASFALLDTFAFPGSTAPWSS